MATKPEDLPKNFIFAPKVDFEYEPLGAYLVGNTYNCAEIPRHTGLRKLCAKWLDEGKISITPVGGFKITQMTIPNPAAQKE